MKTIVVLGHAGYIGSEVFFRLQLMGFDPIGIEKGDRLRKADVVIHLACTDLGGNTPQFVEEEIALCEKVCKKAGKIIFTSSAAVYGNGDKPNVEDQILMPINDYGRAKMACEQVIQTEMKNYTIFRLANVYSKEATHGFISNLLNGDSTLYAKGKRTRDYVHLDDVVRVLIEATLTDKWQGIYNIGTGKQTSAKDIFKRLSLKKPILSDREEIEDSCLDITKARNNGFNPFSL